MNPKDSFHGAFSREGGVNSNTVMKCSIGSQHTYWTRAWGPLDSSGCLWFKQTSWKEWRTSEETTGLLFFLKGSFGAACQSSRLPTEQWQDNVGHLPFFEWSRELHVSLCSCISFTSLNPANQTIGKPTMPNPFPSMLACRHQDPSISNWIPT